MSKATLEERIGKALLERGWSLALAESCTGGLLGYRITSVAGSSRYFRGGIVAYENSAKARLLSVSRTTLHRHGAVSAEVALEMARGARRLFAATAAVSVTGIAGPGGGTPDKPVGLVFAAAAVGRRSRWEEGMFRGFRENIRRRSADMALNLLLTLVEEDK